MPPFPLLAATGGTHDIAEVLLQLLIIFVAAKAAAELFERLKQPAVVGEILAGVLIGPQVLGWAHASEPLQVLAELGVLFLLFNVGLETRPSELRRVGAPAIKVAVGGVVAPFLLGYGLMLGLGTSQVTALFVGVAMVATSVGITARVLAGMGLLTAHPSRIILGAAILDDILGLLALAVVSSFAKGPVNLLQISTTLATSLLFVVVILAFGGKATGGARPLVERAAIGHALYILAIALCLALAVVAGWVGVAPIIGAFLAGTALAEWSEETGLHHRTQDLTEFLLPFFLVSIGMQLQIDSLQKPSVLLLAGGITVLAVIGKLVGCGLPLWKEGRAMALQVGWGMVPRGEVGIVVAQLGLTMGVLNADLFAVALFMAIATTIIAPPAIARAFSSMMGSPPSGEEGVVELEPGFSSELGDVRSAEAAAGHSEAGKGP
jgi:Kef-type K+ transport system membrane component KefB